MKLYQKAEQALLNGLRTGKSTNIRRTKNFVIRLLFYLVVFDLAFVFLYPFITVIADSLKTDNDIVNITVKWLPSSPEWNNYVVAWKRLRYLKYFKNSAIVCGTATLGHVFSCSFAGYAFARYQFRFKNLLFGIVVLAMLVPAQVLIFPLYMQFSNWGWTNTYLPLAVPTFFGFGLSGGFFIFLFRQFFSGLPYEIEEAARIDGCGPFMTYFRIMLPIAKSSVLVAVVLSVVWHWNDYFEPGVYVTNIDKMLLPSRLPVLYSLLNAEQFDPIQVNELDSIIFNEAMLMAATFLVILPVLIVYSILQKKFMEGVERSGLTGM